MNVIKRVWIPIVMIVIVAISATTVWRLHAIFGSHRHGPDHGNADAIIAFNPKRVVYEVLGPTGTVVAINFLDADAQPQEVRHATTPWSITIVTTLSSVVAHVVARGESQALGCRITVNGVVRAERTVVAPQAHTSCLVKSA